jgi:type IV pilus assembly protein PilV
VKRRRSGYTIVELMMSLSVLAIGAAGIIAMQKVTLASNQYAKNLAVANAIALAWADALAADASTWNGATEISTTNWLTLVSNGLVWQRPGFVAAREFGPGFSPLGDPVNTDTNAGLARYCTDLRLGWMKQPTTGAGLIRAEIRVFWKRENAVTNGPLPANICDSTNLPASQSNPAIAQGYHFVFLTTAISQEPT